MIRNKDYKDNHNNINNKKPISITITIKIIVTTIIIQLKTRIKIIVR